MVGIAYFTPETGLVGGALIGLAAGLLLLLSGDILGASGLVSSSLLTPRKTLTDPSLTWKLVFLSTFLVFSNVVLGQYFTNDTRLGNDPSIPVVSIYGYLLGGLFTGFGTRLGNGCPTGHGICGMARLSKRSIVAVLVFMATAFAMACLTAPNNAVFSNTTKFLRTNGDLDTVPVLFNQYLGLGVCCAVILPTILSVISLVRNQPTNVIVGDGIVEDSKSKYSTFDSKASSKDTAAAKAKNEATAEQQQNQFEEEQEQRDNVRKVAPAILCGMVFACGLAVSGMILPSKVLGFLNLFTLFETNTYDPTLACVMGGGVIVSFISYQFVEHHNVFGSKATTRSCPLVTSKFSIPTSTLIDYQLIVGAMCFGIGWAIAGLCPGPAMFLAATGTSPIIFAWWPAFIVGAFIAQQIKLGGGQ